jgi:RNA polymerase nonessential primary-like sigma factor
MGAELAEEIGEKPDKVRELLGFCRQPMSLDRKVGEALETDLGELLPDDRLDPDERMAREMLSWQLNEILASLEVRQREVLTLYLGLDGDRTFSLSEIGKKLNISRQGVQQIQQKR